jgi:hypothetical protein
MGTFSSTARRNVVGRCIDTAPRGAGVAPQIMGRRLEIMPVEAPLTERPEEATSWSARAREPGTPTASRPTHWWSTCFCGPGASGDGDPSSNLHRNPGEAWLCRLEAVVVFQPRRAEERLRRWVEGFSLRAHVKADHEPIAREHGLTGGAILEVSLAVIARVCSPGEGETGKSPISEVDGEEAIRSEPGNNVSQHSSSTDPSPGPAPSTPRPEDDEGPIHRQA